MPALSRMYIHIVSIISLLLNVKYNLEIYVSIVISIKLDKYLLHKFCCGLTNQCHVTERSLRSGAKGNVKVPSIFLGRDTADWSPLSDSVQYCIQITVLEVPLEPVTTVTICTIDAVEDVAEPFNAEKFVEESHLGFSVLLIRSHGHQDPLDIANLLLVAALPVGKRRIATNW